MELLNLSAEYEQKLYSWLPRGLNAERIVFFPDACLALLEGYVELVERFAVIGYMGHLG